MTTVRGLPRYQPTPERSSRRFRSTTPGGRVTTAYNRYTWARLHEVTRVALRREYRLERTVLELTEDQARGIIDWAAGTIAREAYEATHPAL